MDNEAPVHVVIVLKTGQRMTFDCFSFERLDAGYSFVSYPEKRGYKTQKIVRDESIASIEVTAPEPMMEKMQPPAPVPLYQNGDPRVAPSGPKTTLSAFNKLRKCDGTPVAIPLRDREAPPGLGRPMAAIPTFDEEGNQIDVPVGAAMIGS